MKPSLESPAGRTRTVRVIVAVACTVVALGVFVSSAAADGGDLGDGVLELTPVEGAPFEPSTSPQTGGGASLLPDQDAAASEQGAASEDIDLRDVPVTGTDEQLNTQRARLVAERNDLQRRLLLQEEVRGQAELRSDDALEAIAVRLVELFDQGSDERVQALMFAREAEDPDVRASLIAALDPADRQLFAALDRASQDAVRAGLVADRTRQRVLAVGTQIAAIDAVIEDRAGPTSAELARERGERYTIDADFVFATGPIPGIGYWGAVGGGSMLDGWMGYAGAAVGGIGCTPPDPSMHATGAVESGEASWYGPGFDGNGTANGETFDTTQLTAAHKTLPFGTIVRVYSSVTARCVFVRINDRGPYIDGRIIDLSRAAADAIGMESVAPVQLEVYEPS